jgi:hypothetical protein
MKNLEVLRVLASIGDTKVSVVEIEKSSFVRVKKGHETIIISKAEFDDFAKVIGEAHWTFRHSYTEEQING